VVRHIIISVICIVALGACKHSLSPEEQSQAQALRAELEATRKEVAAAEADNSKYSGGAIKTLIALRLEILKTNEALVQQRINAIEAGAKITTQVATTNPDPERAKNLESELASQQKKVSEAASRADGTGGLVGAMAQMSVATETNTLSLLRQQFLVAKYGLALPKLQQNVSDVSAPAASETAGKSAQDTLIVDGNLQEQIIVPTLSHKKFAEQNYQKYIWLDVVFDASGLDKPARAVKGLIFFTDLFGENKFGLRWTIDKPISPGESYTEKGSGFQYNQFDQEHQWMLATDVKDMKVKFRVTNILYQDGTTREF